VQALAASVLESALELTKQRESYRAATRRPVFGARSLQAVRHSRNAAGSGYCTTFGTMMSSSDPRCTSGPAEELPQASPRGVQHLRAFQICDGRARRHSAAIATVTLCVSVERLTAPAQKTLAAGRPFHASRPSRARKPETSSLRRYTPAGGARRAGRCANVAECPPVPEHPPLSAAFARSPGNRL
jgi:hypothetical protein